MLRKTNFLRFQSGCFSVLADHFQLLWSQDHTLAVRGAGLTVRAASLVPTARLAVQAAGLAVRAADHAVRAACLVPVASETYLYTLPLPSSGTVSGRRDPTPGTGRVYFSGS